MITALNSNTFKNLQLDAGAFLIGFDPSTYTDAAAAITAAAGFIGDDTKCLGATRGGGSFKVNRDIRQVEADGKRYDFVGSTKTDKIDAYISTKLIEITKGNLARGLGSADVDTTGNIDAITTRTNYKDTDYIESLCWIGDTDKGVMAIVLDNALNTADFNYTINDKGEGELDVEFHAHQDTVEDYNTAPFTIYLLATASTTSST